MLNWSHSLLYLHQSSIIILICCFSLVKLLEFLIFVVLKCSSIREKLFRRYFTGSLLLNALPVIAKEFEARIFYSMAKSEVKIGSFLKFLLIHQMSIFYVQSFNFSEFLILILDYLEFSPDFPTLYLILINLSGRLPWKNHLQVIFYHWLSKTNFQGWPDGKLFFYSQCKSHKSRYRNGKTLSSFYCFMILGLTVAVTLQNFIQLG